MDSYLGNKTIKKNKDVVITYKQRCGYYIFKDSEYE